MSKTTFYLPPLGADEIVVKYHASAVRALVFETITKVWAGRYPGLVIKDIDYLAIRCTENVPQSERKVKWRWQELLETEIRWGDILACAFWNVDGTTATLGGLGLANIATIKQQRTMTIKYMEAFPLDKSIFKGSFVDLFMDVAEGLASTNSVKNIKIFMAISHTVDKYEKRGYCITGKGAHDENGLKIEWFNMEKKVPLA